MFVRVCADALDLVSNYCCVLGAVAYCWFGCVRD